MKGSDGAVNGVCILDGLTRLLFLMFAQHELNPRQRFVQDLFAGQSDCEACPCTDFWKIRNFSINGIITPVPAAICCSVQVTAL